MAKRIIQTVSGGHSGKAVVRFDSDLQEFSVDLYENKNGVLKVNKNATYFTTDKDDAIMTARDMVQRVINADAGAPQSWKTNPRKRRAPKPIGARSQITGKPPSKRLRARRAKPRKPGYFPNPRPSKSALGGALEYYTKVMGLTGEKVSLDHLAGYGYTVVIIGHKREGHGESYAPGFSANRHNAETVRAMLLGIAEAVYWHKNQRASNPIPGNQYIVQLVRAQNDVNGNPRKAAIVYDAQGRKETVIPYSYGEIDADLVKQGYANHIGLDYTIEISPKEFNFLKGSRRVSNPKKQTVARAAKSNVRLFWKWYVLSETPTGKLRVQEPGYQSQDGATLKAKELAEKYGKPYRVASREWIQSQKRV